MVPGVLSILAIILLRKTGLVYFTLIVLWLSVFCVSSSWKISLVLPQRISQAKLKRRPTGDSFIKVFYKTVSLYQSGCDIINSLFCYFM